MKVKKSQSILSYLTEIRARLIKSLIFVGCIFGVFAFIADDLYVFFAAPLIAKLPNGTNMIATDVASPFLTPLKLAFILAFFISIPYILYQIWSFIAPALYKKEKILLMPLLASSSILFYLGMAFAYWVVFPLVFSFFTKVSPENVLVATDINSYLDFILAVFFAFGIAFEIPIIVIILCWFKITTVTQLKKRRPYVIIMAFVVGMLLTPPDIISQTLLAIPMCLLFELGLLLAKFYERS